MIITKEAMSTKIITIKPLGFPWETQDPFLFCAYHRDEYPSGNEKMEVPSEDLMGRNIGQDFTIKNGWRMYHGRKIPGFPFHPHRGFETITINKEGVVDHVDSMGAAGRFMEGDVQWMTAGKGVQHSEMFPLFHQDKGNTLEIFQLWLNLPRRSKMVDPHFLMLWKEDVPVLRIKDADNRITTIEVIAGQLKDVKGFQTPPNSWASHEKHAVGVFTVSMEPNASWALPKTKEKANRTIFYYQGDSLFLEGQAILSNHSITVVAGQDIHIQNGSSTSRFLILEGIPINEPVVQHGPFVMNSSEEIRETMAEYGRTQFGGWPWGVEEFAHPREKGRFALHADGKQEVK
jgi:quercetin 2,3-dioxygenase